MKLALAMCILFAAITAPAQQAVTAPSPHPKLDAYKKMRAEALEDDYPGLARYRDANAKLASPTNDAKGEKRVVFLGDSITDGWQLDKYFPGKPYVNRGISGQTTTQMLGRFRQDVIALQPKVVVILAGTNDIAGNTGPISDEDIEANFASMAELARANHIRVVFSSILPVHDHNPDANEFYATRPMQRIIALNDWMKKYAAEHGAIYLDYFTPTLDATGHLRVELANDGLHPNDAGLKLMVPLAEAAIAKAMK